MGSQAEQARAPSEISREYSVPLAATTGRAGRRGYGSCQTPHSPCHAQLGSQRWRSRRVEPLAKRCKSLVFTLAVRRLYSCLLTQVYSSNEWDKLIIQFVLPKLGVCLREDFTINPRKQDMVPLQGWVLPWHTLIRQSMFSHLLEVEFFPKWLDVLYIWLIQPSYKANEVATWYVFPSCSSLWLTSFLHIQVSMVERELP